MNKLCVKYELKRQLTVSLPLSHIVSPLFLFLTNLRFIYFILSL